jgi:uncharacterized membrane protein YhaH (DUF805 family)
MWWPVSAEPYMVTLVKVVGLLIICISAIPVLFMVSPGVEKGEPEENAYGYDKIDF